MRILLIDDSRTMRNIQKSVLTQLGHTEIAEAEDGEDAMAKLRSFKPELILCNWNMPHMDGLSFVREFRTFDTSTPIIMCTAESDDEHVVNAIKAGVNNYVVKPFTPDLLSQRINETIAKVCGNTPAAKKAGGGGNFPPPPYRALTLTN